MGETLNKSFKLETSLFKLIDLVLKILNNLKKLLKALISKINPGILFNVK
ncbi:hypothetical protein CQA01_28740 [Cyclobacterium qasimii]|uniref:Uncharacterized protein n=1 Tax=Cyclobacterium qasimii TaxID=1350429 RepID=A0A512CE64_9BACT|nr:hypothetical protein CQA01_28740 [Cyclobacterium qasimii]